ncbi:VOC family protein [Salinimicrobium sp. HB62]|uniref:VOC family protein n=1 Tax=Salinimicrobium sp. HB62 TaxID=3077781 RepID=UPI002D78E36F|nr:VOC family protein [Salinimicrobium sp. HB62]
MKTENPVVWFEIYVNDLKRARSFYEKVFQVQLSELGNPTEDDLKMMAFPSDMDSKGKASGAIVYMKDMKAGGNSTIVYFGSEDCSIEEERVEEAGGEILRSKMSIGEYGFVSIIKDPDGNTVGIHSMK